MDYYRQHQAPGLQQDLTKALQGESDAIQTYEKLASLAPNESIKKVITEIRKDEQRHYRFFAELLKQWYGLGFQPIQSTLPTSFDSGVISSFIDEQETVDFYNDLAEKVTDPMVKQEIRRIAADEQNHAVWFLFFYRH